MTDTPTVPRLWRSGPPPAPGAARRNRLLAVLLVLAAVAGTVGALLYWLAPPRPPAVLPISITASDTGTVPWAEQDRAALASANFFGAPTDDPAANPSRDQIRLRFAALAKLPRSQPAVVHLTAPAAADTAGGVFLLPADGLGDSPRNRLTLAELLAAVRDCPSRHKLLVLNLVPASDDPRFAASPGDLSAAVFRTLEAVPDERRLCLVSCGPGQVPHAAPELGRSVFSYYLEAGLKGAADTNLDNRLTVSELANFVRARVGRWSAENRVSVQLPALTGRGADFTLRGVPATAAADEPAPGEVPYPDWLKTAWESHERWIADGHATAAPGAFELLRAALLRAETDLQAGLPASAAKAELDRRVAQATELANTLRAVPTADPLPTLAAVFPGYALPDPALVEQLRTAAINAESRAPAPAPKDDKTGEPPLPPDFDPFKTKPHALLAAAAFVVLADDADPSAARVRNFAKLLAAQEPQVRFAEVLLIRRLAALADQGALAPWSNERAARALQTARWVEGAAARPAVVAWARPALDEAHRLRARAEAVLFAPGYADPAEAGARLKAAAERARALHAAAESLSAAISTRDEATLWLTGATPLVNSGTVNVSNAVAVADLVAKLNVALESSGAFILGVFFALDVFSEQVPEWDRLALAARSALTAANQPLTPRALQALKARAAAPDAGPAVVAQLDALLASSLVPVAARADLWNARSAVRRRLCEATLKKDTADLESVRKGLTPPPAPERPNEAPYDADLARRRARWTVALLRTAGPVGKLGTELPSLANERFAFADRLRRAWTEDAPALAGRSPNAVSLVPATSAGTEANPLTARRHADALQLWAWHAARFDYEARNPFDPSAAVNGVPFLTAAARSCATAAKTPAFPYLEVVPPSERDRPRLTFEQPSAKLNLTLRAVGARAKATVAALTPSNEWLKPPECAAVPLEAIRDATVALPLAAGSKPTDHPTALGVLVEAEATFDGTRRAFYRRVPVAMRPLSSRIDLLIRTDPKAAPTLAREFRVRPNGVPTGYQFLLVNPSPVEQKVVARLAGLNRETAALVLPPGTPVPLVFASTAVPVPPAPPQPGAPPADGFAPLRDAAITVELLDPANKENVLQTFALPITVSDPASYLRVSDAVFTPARDGRPNRLSVTVVPGDVPAGGPVPVKLAFAAAEPQKLVVRDGSQAGSITNEPVTLYAENIQFPVPTGAKVTATVAADGVERAFTSSAALPTLGETIRLKPVTNPRVRVNAGTERNGGRYAPGTEPLPVVLEVDDSPAGATLELRVGATPDAPDLTLKIPTARARVAKVRFDPKGEGFELAGSLGDHRPTLPVELLTGRRDLEARVLSATGAVVATDRITVIFDGRQPDITFDPPPKAAKNAPLALKAIWATPTASGISEVKFFVGKPNKDELPASPAPVPGMAADGNEWRGTVQMPDVKGLVTVGVRFTTKAGLSTTVVREIELLDAAELNKPAPGAIAGTLREGINRQPNADVFLYDAKKVPLAKATTKADGSFTFKELVPGIYYLHSDKTTTTGRKVTKSVEVKPGATATIELELMFPSEGDGKPPGP